MNEGLYPPPMLFEDFITIVEIEKRFDRVSRIRAHSHIHQIDCEMDINTDIYPINVGERFAIAFSLSVEYSKDSNSRIDERVMQPHTQGGQRYDPTQSSRQTLLDHYEYAMFGRVYGCDVEDSTIANDTSVYISFGGLLMQLKGPKEALKYMRLDLQVYFLMSKSPGAS